MMTYGYVANDDVWPFWPPEFGLVGGALGCNRKVEGSVPPTRGPNWAPISGGGVLPEIRAPAHEGQPVSLPEAFGGNRRL